MANTETVSTERDRLIHILVVHFDMFRDKAEGAADLFLHHKTLGNPEADYWHQCACSCSEEELRARFDASVPMPVRPEQADYLVWSNEHRAWWRANSQGYARSILEAGRYTRAEAVDIADKSRNGWKLDGRPDEIAVAIADLPAPIRAALQLTTRAGSHA